MLIAHGGGNHEFPDNTLEAFYNAYSIDPQVMMETDVSLTRDSVVILSHDTTLDRKTRLINARIAAVNYADLMKNEVDFGYHNSVSGGVNVTGVFSKYTNHLGKEVTPLDIAYPDSVTPRHPSKFLATTLAELVLAFPCNPINVEIKQSGSTGLAALHKVIETMENLDATHHTFARMVLASFHQEIFVELQRIRKTRHPGLLLSPSIASVKKYMALQSIGLDLFYLDPVSVFQVPIQRAGHRFDTPTFIRSAHRHNIAVHYWTVDDVETMHRLIQIGADGIMTNRPWILQGLPEQKN
ncbi:hypothetical protein GX408_17435 [bacterium]|nr:hypothetical protein [bacterium]